MAKLSSERLSFYSEADFQFALAWKIKELDETRQIRLEVPYNPNREKGEKKEHLDILVIENGVNYAFEVKYKPMSSNQPRDMSRYDFIKDIHRLEKYPEEAENSRGYAIMLTDDYLLWGNNGIVTIDEQFKIHEGRRINGIREWSEKSTQSKAPISIDRSYLINWRDYSRYGFRYVVVEVPSLLEGVSTA